MATIGQALTTPEAGWRRLDNTDQNISYMGGPWLDDSDAVFSGGSLRYTEVAGSMLRFNFTGTRLRLIGAQATGNTSSIDLFIDGIKVLNFSQYINSSTIYQTLDADIAGLTDKEHSVSIVPNGVSSSSHYGLDAIDIDETGSLKPYQPTTETQLLRVTVSDSSDHDYQLSSTEIDSFVNWFMKHASTDTAGYMLNKKVGTQESKEYLAFDKIISFEIMPLTK